MSPLEGKRMFERFSRHFLLILVIAGLAFATAWAKPAAKTIQQSQGSSTALSNQDVLGMIKAGLAPDLIIAKIKSSGGNFDTSPETMKKLQIDGVPGEIVMAMIVAGT